MLFHTFFLSISYERISTIDDALGNLCWANLHYVSDVASEYKVMLFMQKIIESSNAWNSFSKENYRIGLWDYEIDYNMDSGICIWENPCA